MRNLRRRGGEIEQGSLQRSPQWWLLYRWHLIISWTSLVPRLSDHAEKELVGESLVSTASGSGCVTTHSDKF